MVRSHLGQELCSKVARDSVAAAHQPGSLLHATDGSRRGAAVYFHRSPWRPRQNGKVPINHCTMVIKRWLRTMDHGLRTLIMCDECMPHIQLPLTIEQFRQMPRNAAYKYEYLNEVAHLSP